MSEQLPQATLYFLGESFGYRAFIHRGGPAYTVTKKTASAALQVLATMAGTYEVTRYQDNTGAAPVQVSGHVIDVNFSVDRPSQGAMLLARIAAERIMVKHDQGKGLNLPPVNLDGMYAAMVSANG